MGQGVPLRVPPGSNGSVCLVQKQDEGFGNSDHPVSLRISSLELEELAVHFQHCLGCGPS